MRRLCIGNPPSSALDQAVEICVYMSLVDIVIQSTESSTRDIREMLRLLCILWPTYTKPLLAESSGLLIECAQAFQQMTKEELNAIIKEGKLEDQSILQKISENLGSKIRVHIREVIKTCLLNPGLNYSPNENSASRQTLSHRLPYFTKFVLLAAYLCQSNRADRDRKLYTNQKSARRKRGQGKETNTESVSYASSAKAQQELQSTKVPSFPFERMFSIFSSICRKSAAGSMKHAYSKMMDPSIDSIDVSELGSIGILSSIRELCDLGLLTELRSILVKNDQSAMNKGYSNSKYTCNLARGHANEIATSVGFNLSEFLTEDC